MGLGAGGMRRITTYLLTYLPAPKCVWSGSGSGGLAVFARTRQDETCVVVYVQGFAWRAEREQMMHACIYAYESLKVLLFSMCGLAGTFGAPSRKSSERSVFCCRFLVSSEERTARIINSEPRHSLLCQCGCSMVCVYYICLLRGMDGPKIIK